MTGLVFSAFIATVIAFRSQRRRSANLHAQLDAVLSSAEALDAELSLRAVEREEMPTIH